MIKFEPINDKLTKSDIEIQAEQAQEYKLTLESSITPHENHTIFEIDIVTRIIKIAEFEKTDYIFNPNWYKGMKLKEKGVIIRNHGKEYVSALNKKNALKHFNNGFNGTRFTGDDYLSL
jgi:hypothetical protein